MMALSEDYIIDFQAFKDDQNRFVLKEVSICSLQTNLLFHYLIKPPYNIKYLSLKSQKQVEFVVKNIHGVR